MRSTRVDVTSLQRSISKMFRHGVVSPSADQPLSFLHSAPLPMLHDRLIPTCAFRIIFDLALRGRLPFPAARARKALCYAGNFRMYGAVPLRARGGRLDHFGCTDFRGQTRKVLAKEMTPAAATPPRDLSVERGRTRTPSPELMRAGRAFHECLAQVRVAIDRFIRSIARTAAPRSFFLGEKEDRYANYKRPRHLSATFAF